ncbi:MAG: DNA topoisomerase VI subunit B, partial [Candidatus Thermoplasmatota archaeon]|nr:DNA topoisomerase VI subunit B [Candidatus Thermoplasmatota archaeon]
PFTSESKEAIADVEDIENEIKLALRACARNVQRHIRKKVRRKKTRDKFVLISKILPEIAKKSSSMLEKPVPALESVITKIMDVVWIEDLVEYEKVKQQPLLQTTLLQHDTENPMETVLTKSLIKVVNYKQKPQKFSLYAVIPEDAVIKEANPKPVKKTSQYIKWNLEKIPPASKVDVTFELYGLEKGDFDENDLYIKNINPGYVIGADKWEGD